MNCRMTSQWVKKLIAISATLSLFLIGSFIFAKDIPKPPSPFRLVIDNVGLLDQSQQAQLERKLRLFDDSTSTQVVVYLDQTLEGEEIFDYSQRLAESWGIGQKGKNNGVLVYMAVQDRKIYIQVGYGLEGIIPDAAAKKIISNYIVPAFKKGDYYAGLDKATDIIISLAKNEFTAQEFVKRSAGNKPVNWIGSLIFIILIIFFVFGRMGFFGGFLMGSAWGSFSGGSGSFGGGGFSGGSFGGGSFGGGGAGGSW
jgi:uncharacterized protein